jgi:hypothetical protein
MINIPSLEVLGKGPIMRLPAEFLYSHGQEVQMRSIEVNKGRIFVREIFLDTIPEPTFYKTNESKFVSSSMSSSTISSDCPKVQSRAELRTKRL